MAKPIHPWTTRTAVDTKLQERYPIDSFTLIRLRRELHQGWRVLTSAERKALSEGGTVPRFAMLIKAMEKVLIPDQWARWLGYTEYHQRDIDEMCRGEYPISPWLIRVFSAPFGINVDYLLLGTGPEVERAGANIDLWLSSAVR